MNKGRMYINKIDKYINNNESVYYVDVSKEKNEIDKKDIDVSKKIREIFNSKNFIYKADVVIETKDGIYNKRLIGRNKKNLITSENELISISDIIDINYKKGSS